MHSLDRLLPTPRLVELDSVDLAIPPARAWAIVRHVDLGKLPIAHALFTLRTIPSRLLGNDEGKHDPPTLDIDDLASSPERPGFQILVDAPPNEMVAGAIGKVWHLDIPFRHVPDAEAFRAFDERGFVKVAWALRVSALGEHHARVTVEVRVDATDEESWAKFKRYFLVIGPASRFIRRTLLASFAREHGTPEQKENEEPLLGDDLLPDAAEQLTHGITIAASPEAIWPWLVQLGCRRAGYYSYDMLDNGGVPSAREIHPELQDLHVGDVLPATPESEDGFEVLRIEPSRALVLGGLFDGGTNRQLLFAADRPERFWQVTWAFVLEPLDTQRTRLHVRARAAFPSNGKLHAAWIRPVHHFMQTEQLRNLAARAEHRLPKDDWRDVRDGIGGAAVMTAAFLTPFLRDARSHWGIDAETAARTYPGDDLVRAPRWSWTHGVEIDAPPDVVWPWVAQIGADRGGFYSYQWLENVAGCDLVNAETVHPDWAVREGDGLLLHPKMPPLPVVSVAPGRYFVAFGPADAAARASGGSWIEASWLFFLEPLPDGRTRFVSRYRCASSDDLATRVQFGPSVVEPIGFAMDRRMLLGVKERVERSAGRSVASG